MLLFLGLVGAICLVGLFALHSIRKVRVGVESCVSEGKDMTVVLRYSNQLKEDIAVSCDVELSKDGGVSKYGTDGLVVVKDIYVPSVHVRSGGVRIKTVHLTVFPHKQIFNAAIRAIKYRVEPSPAKNAGANQSSEGSQADGVRLAAVTNCMNKRAN